MGQSRKLLYSLGTVGSNPTPSASFRYLLQYVGAFRPSPCEGRTGAVRQGGGGDRVQEPDRGEAPANSEARFQIQISRGLLFGFGGLVLLARLAVNIPNSSLRRVALAH